MMCPCLILPKGLGLMGTNFGTRSVPIGPAAAGWATLQVGPRGSSAVRVIPREPAVRSRLPV
jgi:hypothetical protein